MASADEIVDTQDKTSAQDIIMQTNKADAAKQAALAKGKAEGKNWMTGRPMTLEEHDKAVHGGHYDGGRCKFREQMKNGMMGKAGERVRQLGVEAMNKMKGAFGGGKGEGAGNQQPAAPKVEQADGELKQKFGAVNTTSQKAMGEVNEIQKLYNECQTQEAKDKIAEIYKGLVTKLNGGASPTGGGEGEPPKANADGGGFGSYGSKEYADHNEVDDDFNKEMDFLDEQKSSGAISEEDYNAKRAKIELTNAELHEKLNQKGIYEGGGEEPPNADGNSPTPPKDGGGSEAQHKMVDDWFNGEMNKLDELKKGGKIDDKTYEHRRAYLESQNAKYHETINKRGSGKDQDGYTPRPSENASEGRKAVQKALTEHHQSQGGGASEGASNGGYKPKPPAQGKSISEQRKELQGKLSTLQFLFGKNSIVGGMISNSYAKKFDKLDEMERKQKEDAAKAKAEGGQSSGAELKRYDGVRRMFGGLKHNGNPEVIKMVNELENEFANAKTRKEKMALIKEFKSMQKEFGADEYKWDGGSAGGSGDGSVAVAKKEAPKPKSSVKPTKVPKGAHFNDAELQKAYEDAEKAGDTEKMLKLLNANWDKGFDEAELAPFLDAIDEMNAEAEG